MEQPVIRIKDLTRYYGKSKGIEHVNLSINQGEIFGFIGPNGAGKSTTIRILLNLIFPTGGSAEIMGMDVIKESKKIKNLTGYIPSDANAYENMTAGAFLRYCSRFYSSGNSDRKIRELTVLFDLDTKRKIADLSRGNRKKVAIIQSLVHNPKLLILDEPTTGLDPLMQERFFDLLRKENHNGMTIFFSSHVLSEVQLLCERIAIIKAGNIIKIEHIDTLRKKQLKKVFIEFEENLTSDIINIKGIENIMQNTGNMLSFVYSGDINDLIVKLSGKKLMNMTIEEPSLEEIFMHYYK
ncbi:MAG: ABC transporter ATP-binding protein [Bacteroidales bacterium]|nr:ABC transporter ATP-binding protein [Bacteroidales bacterium]